jgi:hypothetical protein
MLRPTVRRLVYPGIKHPFRAYDQIFITIWQLLFCFCGAPSLTGGRVCLLYMLLSLASAFPFGVPLVSWTYFTVSDLRLPFSSPLTTRRVTVEVFDPASTRVTRGTRDCFTCFARHDTDRIANSASNNSCTVACVFLTAVTVLQSCCVATIRRIFTEALASNEWGIHIYTQHDCRDLWSTS